MTQAKPGDTVKVHYTGRLDDGTVFDSSVDREPIEFSLGQGHVIPGFEQAVVGMSSGDSKTVTISSDQAYGPHREELVLDVSRQQMPPDLAVEVGQQLQMSQGDGEVMLVLVTDVSDATITLDANHPLAGEDLTFDIQLVAIS